MVQLKVGNHYINKANSIEERVLFAWLINVVILTFARFFLTQLNIYGLTRTIILWWLASIPILYIMLNNKVIEQRKYIFFLFIFFLSALSFGLTALLNQDIAYFYTRESYGLERVFRPDSAIYALLFFGLIEDADKILNVIRKYAYIDFVYLLLFQLLPAYLKGGWEDISYRGNIVLRQYSLSFGYSMLLPSIIFLYLFLKERKIFNLSLGVIGLILILLNGSRGAMIMPIIFGGLMMINNIVKNKDVSWKILKITAITLMLVMIIVFWDDLMRRLISFAAGLGIKSRTIEMLMSGDISNNNGRSAIWIAVITAIKEGGIFGYGTFGDRPFVYPIHYVAYSHNLVLEIICSYGIIGIIICGTIVVNTVRMIFFCRDNQFREIFIIFVSVAAQLLFSMSFWYVWEFWAAIAIAHVYHRRNKLSYYNYSSNVREQGNDR